MARGRGRCYTGPVADVPQHDVTPGETVAGMVVVNVNTGCTCNGLDVQVRWQTHGRGNRKYGDAARIRLFTGEWKAGEEHIHPFELTLPDPAVASYEGTVLNVEWAVEATADIPWAFDPEASAPIRVRPGTDPGPLFEAKRGELKTQSNRSMMVFALVWLAICIPSLLIPTAVAFSEGGDDAFVMIPFLLLFDAIFFAVGAFLLFRAVSQRIAERRLGDVIFEAPADPVRAGDLVPVRVIFTPVSDIEGKVTARFKGQEVVVSGSGVMFF